jgi:hypothetical protein
MPITPTPKITQVKPDVEWGMYMWRLPNGKLFNDGDGSYLNIPSRKHDLQKISEIRQAAAYYGQPDGTLHFEPGVTRSTDEEVEEQREMMAAGEIHDKDIGAIVDEKKSVAKDNA